MRINKGMDNTLKIEKVCEKDAGELLKIYAPYVENTAISFEYEVPSLEEFESRISTISTKYPYLKAVRDNEILGYAYAGPFKTRRAYDWSVETTVYVRGDQREKGIGSLLYNKLEEELKKMGILNMNACIASPIEESIYLTDDSIKFHTKMGFQMVGKFHNSGCKFGKWFDMVWMEKMIGKHVVNPEPIQR